MIDIKKAVRAAIQSDKARFTLCSGASIAALYALTSASPVFAADTAGASAKGSDDLEEIVVSGYRKSLQSAQEIKRDADVMVDSVTSADIGELPDRSVTEAIQRIPGVVINRFSAGVDPDHFSVEGSGVTIRGLSYVHSELNGRDTFSASNGRALSFADVPSELLGGVDVFKSPSSDRIEGGIGGVVNLRTRLPFDTKGLQFSGSAEENYGDFAKKWSPAGSFLITDRWETGIGEIGALGSISYSELKSRADKIQISNFALRGLQPDGKTLDEPVLQSDGSSAVPTGDTPVYMPRGAVGGSQLFDHTRRGLSAALQWRSPDESWEATAQFMKSDSREAWTEHTTEIATDNVTSNGDSQAEPISPAGPLSQLSFSPSGLFSSGTISTPATGWRDDQFSGTPRIPITGLQSNNITRGVQQKYVTEDTSVHLKWKATDKLQFDMDYQHVLSTVDNLDLSLLTSSYQDAFIALGGADGSELPTVNFVPPVCFQTPQDTGQTQTSCTGAVGTRENPAYLSAAHPSYADPYNSFYRAAMDHIEQSDGQENAFRLDATIDAGDNNWVKSFKVGYRYADRDQTARFSTYNWGALSESWANGGPVWLDNPNVPADYASYNFPNFYQGKIASPFGSDGRLYYNGPLTNDYTAYTNFAWNVVRTWNPSGSTSQDWIPLGSRPGVTPGSEFLPSEINPVDEKNNAIYVMANFLHNMQSGWKLTGNLGVRYTKTKRVAQGGTQFQQQTLTSDADCDNPPPNPDGSIPTPNVFCFYSVSDRNNIRNFFNGAYLPSTVELTYSYVLPSLNLKLDVGNGLQYRFDYFKGVAAPDFGYTRNDFNVSPQVFGIYDQNHNQIGVFTEADSPSGAGNGNPYLKPTTSDNYDFSVEWYFSSVGQLTAAVFYKELKNVVTNGDVRTTITNNGITLPAVTTSPYNSPDTGKIKGIEIGYQQTYDFLPGWLSGFGLSANYTYVSSDGVKQTTLSNTDPDVAAQKVTTIDTSLLPLQGLSKNSFNITPFYQKGPFEARLAYNWRSEFLLTPRDVIVPFQPILNEATGTLDGSVFFSINSHIKLGLQVANITNETTKTRAVINNSLLTGPRGFYTNDRRFTLGLRWTL